MDNKLMEEIKIRVGVLDEYNKLYLLIEDVACEFDEWREEFYLGNQGVWHTYNDHPKAHRDIEFKTTKELFTYFITNIYKPL